MYNECKYYIYRCLEPINGVGKMYLCKVLGLRKGNKYIFVNDFYIANKN